MPDCEATSASFSPKNLFSCSGKTYLITHSFFGGFSGEIAGTGCRIDSEEAEMTMRSTIFYNCNCSGSSAFGSGLFSFANFNILENSCFYSSSCSGHGQSFGLSSTKTGLSTLSQTVVIFCPRDNAGPYYAMIINDGRSKVNQNNITHNTLTEWTALGIRNQEFTFEASMNTIANNVCDIPVTFSGHVFNLTAEKFNIVNNKYRETVHKASCFYATETKVTYKSTVLVNNDYKNLEFTGIGGTNTYESVFSCNNNFSVGKECSETNQIPLVKCRLVTVSFTVKKIEKNKAIACALLVGEE